jgi:hypothetical protein
LARNALDAFTGASPMTLNLRWFWRVVMYLARRRDDHIPKFAMGKYGHRRYQ